MKIEELKEKIKRDNPYFENIDIKDYQVLDFLTFNEEKANCKKCKGLSECLNSKKGFSPIIDNDNNISYVRCKYMEKEIEIAKSFEKEFSRITDGIKKGEISFSVTHNDPKINNVLFDKFSGEIRAVVDLDTIMPGSYLYDFLRLFISSSILYNMLLSLLVLFKHIASKVKAIIPN